ncbi:TPA: chromosome partitioning protein [Klebsiella variicola subsp. variicola]|nr:chromosome partitioning protein [Klebsiella variicola subsp. variicola]
MLKIAILGGKGGITKSTYARALGVSLAKRQYDVIGFDTDGDQASFWRWNERRKKHHPDLINFPVVTGSNPVTIRKQIADRSAAMAGKKQAAVIDGAAYASKTVIQLAEIADLVVLPTRYSVDDMESAYRIYQELTQAGIPSHRIAIAFSGVSESKREHREAASTFEDAGIYVIPGYIPQLTSYSTAQDKGLSVCEVQNQPRLFTLARWMIDATIDRALEVEELNK